MFSNISNSSVASSSKIHSSSSVTSSKIEEFTTIRKNVSIENCSIACYCLIMDGCYFHKTILGDYSYSNMHTTILRSEIGKFCSIASHVFIGPTSHPLDKISTHPFLFFKNVGNLIDEDEQKVVDKREGTLTKIGNDVWIGQGATIMPGITIGDGAIVGARSVVTKDVEPYSIVMGLPAKRTMYRFDKEIVDRLTTIEWWNWNRSKIKENIKEFSNIEAFVNKHDTH